MARTRRRTTTTPRVTIKDVARNAGVSVTTVSNVLNGRIESMGEETLLRIKETIRALNFRPSNLARGLVNRRTATIGLIIAEIETPLFIQALTFMEPLARSAGYNVLMCNARNLDEEQQTIELLLEKEVDGIIFLSTSVFSEDGHIRSLLQTGMPTVLINRSTSYPEADQINWDNSGGVEAAVRHLASLGHRRIAHLAGPPDRQSSVERLRGYHAGLAACEIEPVEEYVQPGDYSAAPEEWRRSTLRLLDLAEPPTAIIAADDTVAAVVLKTAQQAGLRIPQDLAVIGIDDQPFGKLLNPALSTVRLPVVEAGMQATEMLLGRIKGSHRAGQHTILSCPLMTRESCGAATAGHR